MCFRGSQAHWAFFLFDSYLHESNSNLPYRLKLTPGTSVTFLKQLDLLS